MRTPLALGLILLAALLPACPALAQDDGGTTRVLDDPAGDVAVATPGPAMPPPPGQEYLDLVALDVTELPEGFAVRLTMAGAPAEREEPLLGTMTHTVGFAYGGVAYAVRIDHGVALAGSRDEAVLLADRAGGDAYEAVQGLPVERVGAAVTATIPRLALVDAGGAPAFPGQALAGFWAASSGATGFALTAGGPAVPAAADRAPATGTAPTAVTVRFGARQEGDLRLSSPQPFRASNGEAATFRFPANLTNLGGGELTAELVATGVPAGWTVHVPPPVTVAPGAAARLEVLADVPFAHQHGTFATFVLEARAPGSVGRAAFGLLYVSPAQPAGHHDTLFLHSSRGLSPAEAMDTALGSASGAVEAYWNTLEDDDGDKGLAVPPDFAVTEGTGESTYTWSVPLRPGLAIGLDVDLAGLGLVHVPIATTAPADDAVLWASVHVAPPGNGTPPDLDAALTVAGSGPSPPTDLGARATTVLEAVLVPEAKADLVPYQPGQQLWLRLRLVLPQGTVLETGPATPMLAPGGFARLPLLEYSDARDPGHAAAASGAPADADGPAPKDSPLAPLLALAAVGAAAVWRRRRAP